MDFGGQNKNSKKAIFRVEWIGNDPNHVFTKEFSTLGETQDFLKSNSEAIGYKVEKRGKDSTKWKIIPSESSKEMIRAIELKRRIKDKKGYSTFINADGMGSNETVTTTEFKTHQNLRILSTIAISGSLAYAGHKMENKYVKYGFWGLALINAYVNVKNFNFNKVG